MTCVIKIVFIIFRSWSLGQMPSWKTAMAKWRICTEYWTSLWYYLATMQTTRQLWYFRKESTWFLPWEGQLGWSALETTEEK